MFEELTREAISLAWIKTHVDWLWLWPIVILTPGWFTFIPPAGLKNLKKLLEWVIVTIIAAFFIAFCAHYGLGAGDLGPGPV